MPVQGLAFSAGFAVALPAIWCKAAPVTLLCIKLCTESMHTAREGADAAGAALQIPAGEQKTVRFCYWAFLGFDIAVLFNVFGSLCALCALGPGAGRLPAFFLSACYACAGIPGAWILW